LLLKGQNVLQMGKIKIIFPKKNLGILIEVNPIRIGGGPLRPPLEIFF